MAVTRFRISQRSRLSTQKQTYSKTDQKKDFLSGLIPGRLICSRGREQSDWARGTFLRILKNVVRGHFVLTLFNLKAPNYMWARTLTKRVI